MKGKTIVSIGVLVFVALLVSWMMFMEGEGDSFSVISEDKKVMMLEGLTCQTEADCRAQAIKLAGVSPTEADAKLNDYNLRLVCIDGMCGVEQR